MKRQKIRALLLMISLLLFPLTLYYFSPALIIMGALEGIITGSFITFGLLFLGAVMFGRLFCSWVCPAGCIMEYSAHINEKTPKLGRRRWIKYVIWAVWIGIILFCFSRAGKITDIDIFFQTDYGISIAAREDYIIYYGILAVLFVPPLLFGKRAFCHYLCWMAPFMVLGIKLRRWLCLPGLHLSADSGRCTSCGICSRSCPMSLEIQQMAGSGTCEDPDCILCGVCIDRCPNKVLRYRIRKGALTWPMKRK